MGNFLFGHFPLLIPPDSSQIKSNLKGDYLIWMIDVRFHQEMSKDA